MKAEVQTIITLHLSVEEAQWLEAYLQDVDKNETIENNIMRERFCTTLAEVLQ